MAEISKLEEYCEWMKNLFTPIPDGHYELKFFAADEADKAVATFATFHGTQTGPGGPVPPTDKKIAADYVYHMVFDGQHIKHMTKIWNDSISMQQLGWDWSSTLVSQNIYICRQTTKQNPIFESLVVGLT